MQVRSTILFAALLALVAVSAVNAEKEATTEITDAQIAYGKKFLEEFAAVTNAAPSVPPGVVVFYNGEPYIITVITGSWNTVKPQIQAQPWWADKAVATEFTEKFHNANAVPGIVGPAFGYGTRTSPNVRALFVAYAHPPVSDPEGVTDFVIQFASVTTWAIAYKPDCTIEPGAAGCGDPHLQGFHGHKYEFCEENDGAHCKGLVFNMLSANSYQLNTKINRHAGPNAWPHAGTWMTGYGFKYGKSVNLEVELNTNVDWEVTDDTTRGYGTRAQPVEGGFKKLLAAVHVNGENVINKVESGETLDFGDSFVFFPATKHAHDPTSGPVAIVKTPDFEFGVFLEAGDIWHLDMHLKILGSVNKMHGLLGQSMHWDKSMEAKIEGNELDYVVKEGLLGDSFAYNLFTGANSQPLSKSRRALLLFNHLIGLEAGAAANSLQLSWPRDLA